VRRAAPAAAAAIPPRAPRPEVTLVGLDLISRNGESGTSMARIARRKVVKALSAVG
jgi:hypothetical protein